MLDKLVELCKHDLVSTIVESESPKIMIPFCTSILSALVILPNDVKVQPVEKISYDENSSVRFKNIKRFETELKWIKLLQTPFPLGFNDNIYHEGNISKMPDFDVLTLSESRKRRSRSRGIRKKGNDKRKRCAALKLNISLNDLAVKLRIHGRHPMLSYLSSLPIAALRSLDTEVNRFYDRNHQMYDAALLTRCYTQHALRPYIDSESNITLEVFLKFLSSIKKLTLLIYQAYSRINQWYSLYLPTSKIQNLLLFVTNITNQSEILFLISINLFLILTSMLILLI